MIGLILTATAAGRVVWCAGAQPRARLGQYDLSLAIVPGDFVLLRVASPDGAVVWEGRGDDDAERAALDQLAQAAQATTTADHVAAVEALLE